MQKKNMATFRNLHLVFYFMAITKQELDWACEFSYGDWS
jgi:hypothetical protein